VVLPGERGEAARRRADLLRHGPLAVEDDPRLSERARAA
jgi:hypothetical protein